MAIADLITHHYAQATLRFANAPGYPLFTIVGWLWFQASALLAPWFNPIQRLSLYSTLYAIPALALLYSLLIKIQLPASPPAPSPDLRLSRSGEGAGGEVVLIAVCATLFFAFTRYFWHYSVSTENYTSATLQIQLMILLALRWQERRNERTLLWLAFVCGLSLAHQVTVALAVPAFIVFVLGQQPDTLRKPRLIFKTALVAFAPLLSYAYVYWRGAEHPEWRGQGQWPSAWAWFVDFVSTKQGQHTLGLGWLWEGIPRDMLRLVTNELTLPVLVGGLIGLCLLPRWRAGLLLGMIAVFAPFLYIDRDGNWYETIIALYPLWVIGIVVLANRVLRVSAFRVGTMREAVKTHERATRQRPPGLTNRWLLPAAWLKAALVASFALLALTKLMDNYPIENHRDRPDATGLAPGWALLADAPAQGAWVAGTYAENLALDYLTQIWGVRPDVKRLSATLAASKLGEPLYVSRSAMPLAQDTLPASARLSAQGLNLIAVKTEISADPPPSARLVGQTVGPGLELAGYEVFRDAEHLDLALYWRATRPMALDLAISLRPLNGGQLLNAEGQPIVIDSLHPVGGFYPTTRWLTGEIVRDDYALPAEGAEQARVVVYRALAGGYENFGDALIPLH
ncbi:MAG: DUF2723 domain-containing protein [Chloroflexi bacterium]|nr:DUF2723 domain-containing protein [Chloroflexota bacterium]